MFQLIESSFDEYRTRSERPREPKRHWCRRCDFVFQLEVLDTGSDGLAIVITQWLDLGSGLTPMDRKWRVLTAALVDGYDVKDHASEAERYRLDFEKREGLAQQAITLRNASYLSDQRYKHIMTKAFYREWILQAGRRVHLCYWSGLCLVLLGLMLCAVIGWQSSYKI